jgi:hypothetical protein
LPCPGAGILFGSDVLGLLHFNDFALTNQVANLALVFILFHGGDGTRRADFQAVALPAGGLVTWGVSLRRFRVVCGVNDRSFLRPPARYRACSPLRDTRAPRHP